MRLAFIVAVARNRVIGKGGQLPWHISEDLKRFKRLTTGHAVLMGRKTFESIGRPLPNRRNVVISSSSQPGVETYRTVPEALEALKDQKKVFVIGGGQLFACLIDSADELYLTLVDQDVAGDTFFPPYEHLLGTRFREVGREEHERYTFIDYKRM